MRMRMRLTAERPARLALLTMLVAMALSGCGVHDEKAGLDRADYESLLARRGPEQSRPAVEPPIPDLQPILAAPTPPEAADQRRVTINVTEQTPLKDVLIELARKAEVELELDPRIQGGVIFSARNRPFADVVRRIADLAGLRYNFEDNVLRMELDEPYTKNYRVDVLNLVRTVTSSISASTDVFAAVGGGAAGDNGSQTQITNQAENDFWTEIREGITAIIEETTPPARTSTAAASGPTLPGGAGTTDATGAAGGGTGGEETTGGAAGQIAQAQQIADQTAAATQAATTSGTAGTTGGGGTTDGGGAGDAADDDGHYFTLNRQAGLISVYAPQATQRKVSEYLEALQQAIRGQVLIEAKVIEVTLDDQFQAGINWDSFRFDDVILSAALSPTIPDAQQALAITTSAPGHDLNATLRLLNQFGTTRTLSSPRLTVTNNETAMLKVAQNEVYFTVTVESETDDTGTTNRTFSSELNTVPIGLLMSVQPSVNHATNRVSLNLRPTVSRIVEQKEDPGVALQVAQINSQRAAGTQELAVSSSVPVVEVRELDSVVNMESGAILVMGGLMQERSINRAEKVPVAGDIPLVGNAFRSRDDLTEVVELVILIRATIVRDRETVHPADIDLYNKFTPDPRPFGF